MKYEDMRAALQVMGLKERPTLREIKTRHRELVKRHHPDVGNENDNEAIRKINDAYVVVLAYVTGYRFSFTENEFLDQNPDERLRRQFMNSP